jgi:alkylation response protein AidB-like acyl-CoA dehydrogenase
MFHHTPSSRLMIASSSTMHASVLSDELLIRCHERVPLFDRENRFGMEDFEELQQAGYLRLPIPTAFGGPGLSLSEVVREQRRLAYFAAPTAEAVAMHFGWVGVAASLWQSGDRSLQWVLEEAARGRIFSAGHAESGHDVPLTSSTTRAERVQGGYRITGHKSFGALGPVWDYMGLHALDESDPMAPVIVHVFMPRNTEGYARRDGAESLGMRATRRDETLLDGAFIPDRYLARTVAAGPRGLDPFVVTLMAWQLLGAAAVSAGMARRALDITMEALRTSGHAASGLAMAQHAGVQQRVADMGLALEAIEPHLHHTAAEWSNGVLHGARWPMKLLAAKHHAAEGAWRVIDTALDLAGGLGVSRRAGLEQLFRDARLSRLHPGNALYVHEVVGRTLLGLP